MAYSYHRVGGSGDIEIKGDSRVWIAALFVAAVFAIAWFGPQAVNQHFGALPPPLPSAHVKITMPDGHGSATHIGNGLYVTAAHVVTDRATVDINGQQSAVLWANKEYDIALVAGPELAASVPLSCMTPSVGTEGVAHGNPLFLENIEATGRIAGVATELFQWKLVVPVDGTLADGMSGGAWVANGEMVGVNVGIVTAPMGITSSLTGFSVIVPASVVCELLGRS